MLSERLRLNSFSLGASGFTVGEGEGEGEGDREERHDRLAKLANVWDVVKLLPRGFKSPPAIESPPKVLSPAEVVGRGGSSSRAFVRQLDDENQSRGTSAREAVLARAGVARGASPGISSVRTIEGSESGADLPTSSPEKIVDISSWKSILKEGRSRLGSEDRLCRWG